METFVIDPVCGAQVNPYSAKYQYRYLSKTYFFCSDNCAYIFDEEPEKYAGEIDVDFPFKEEE